MTEVMRLLVMSVRDLLDEWFESAELKGLLASAGVRGLTQGPFAGGTTFNLLHHLTIGDGYFRATAKGGIGAISRALAAAAQAHGAELRTNAGALRVVVTDGVATGVQLASGETIAAAQVISDYDARHTFTQLVDPPELEPEFNRAVREHSLQRRGRARSTWRCASCPASPVLPTMRCAARWCSRPAWRSSSRPSTARNTASVSDQPYHRGLHPHAWPTRRWRRPASMCCRSGCSMRRIATISTRSG